MAFRLPRFYPILDRSLRPELALAEAAACLRAVGVRLVQVRAPNFSSQRLLTEAEELVSLLAPHTSLMVNDRSDVALFARAAGVHLGQDDLPVSAARALLGPESIIGFSTHNFEQLVAAEQLAVDYVAFGPVFPTATKPGAHPTVGLEGLRAARKQTRKPIVAIGGITPQNAAAVIEAGADSVAAIGGWLADSDLASRLEVFRQALGALN